VRSRNGNLPFLLTSLTLVTTLFGGSDDYYIGYRLTAKNTQAINETLTVSKAMRPCNAHPNGPKIIFNRTLDEPLEKVLKREQTPFLEFAASNELHIKSNETFGSSYTQTLNSLTLLVRCYAVEFNDELVTITATN
jgi:hypothetical protein